MHSLFLFAFLTLASSSPTNLVTEEDLLAALDDSHPAMLETSEQVQAARARLTAASTFENPVLSIAREDPSGPGEQIEWTMSWQAPHRGRRLEIAALESETDAAAARRDRDRRALRFAVRETYARWAIAAAREERLSTRLDRVEALAARETARAERGEISGLAAHRARLAARALRARFVLTATNADEARARISIWAPELPRDARPALPALPESTDLARSVETSPRLRAVRAEIQAASLEIEAAGRFVRSPAISLGWQHQETDAGSPDGPLVGIAWSVPLFARNQGARELAAARLAAARAREEILRREIEAEHGAELRSYRRLTEELARMETAISENEKMLAGAETAFRHGEASLTDLLDTLRVIDDTETATLDLYAAALAAHREIELLTGTDLSKEKQP